MCFNTAYIHWHGKVKARKYSQNVFTLALQRSAASWRTGFESRYGQILHNHSWNASHNLSPRRSSSPQSPILKLHLSCLELCQLVYLRGVVSRYRCHFVLHLLSWLVVKFIMAMKWIKIQHAGVRVDITLANPFMKLVCYKLYVTCRSC